MGNCVNKQNSSAVSYGWIRDSPDFRDILWINNDGIEFDPNINLIDLRNDLGPVTNQGNIHSSPADAITSIYQHLFNKKYNSLVTSDSADEKKTVEDNPTFQPSRAFLLYNGIHKDNLGSVGTGCSIRNCLKAFAEFGCCSESRLALNNKNASSLPPDECYRNAKRHFVKTYGRLKQDLNLMKLVLQTGNLFVFGCSIMDNFHSKEVATSGLISIPTEECRPIGSQALVACGYDSTNRLFIVRNSWGTDWGDNGYAYLPFDYILNENLCADFWVISEIHWDLQAISPEPSNEEEVTDETKDDTPAEFTNLNEISLEDDNKKNDDTESNLTVLTLTTNIPENNIEKV